MSLEQIIECVQTYGHQAYDDYDTFYLGRYTVRDDGTTLASLPTIGAQSGTGRVAL